MPNSWPIMVSHRVFSVSVRYVHPIVGLVRYGDVFSEFKLRTPYSWPGEIWGVFSECKLYTPYSWPGEICGVFCDCKLYTPYNWPGEI